MIKQNGGKVGNLKCRTQMYDQTEWGKCGQFEILTDTDGKTDTHTHLHYTLVQEDKLCIFFRLSAVSVRSRV